MEDCTYLTLNVRALETVRDFACMDLSKKMNPIWFTWDLLKCLEDEVYK